VCEGSNDATTATKRIQHNKNSNNRQRNYGDLHQCKKKESSKRTYNNTKKTIKTCRKRKEAREHKHKRKQNVKEENMYESVSDGFHY